MQNAQGRYNKSRLRNLKGKGRLGKAGLSDRMILKKDVGE
jgi:hypothetical protein